jgi:hypothetical protein
MLNEGGYFICGIPIGEGCIKKIAKKGVDKLFSLFNNYIGSVITKHYMKH